MSSTSYTPQDLAGLLTTDAEPILQVAGEPGIELVVAAISVDDVDQAWPEETSFTRHVVAGLLQRGEQRADGTEYDVCRYWTVYPNTVRRQWAQLVASLSPEDRAHAEAADADG
jgi:hypothetical protein